MYNGTKFSAGYKEIGLFEVDLQEDEVFFEEVARNPSDLEQMAGFG
jgi:hypothetical protein